MTASQVTISLEKAKKKFLQLVRDAEAGKRVVISRNGRAVVELLPVRHPRATGLGMDRGLIEIADDFDKTPECVIRGFEGRASR